MLVVQVVSLYSKTKNYINNTYNVNNIIIINVPIYNIKE